MSSAPIRTTGGTLQAAIVNGRALLANHPDAAEKQARVILRGTPDFPPALRLLGAALRKQGQDAAAEEAELQAVIAARRLPAIDRAMQAIGANRLDVAEQLLRAFLAQDPEDAAAALLLGETLGKIGQFNEAEALLKQSIAASPGFLDAKIALANLYEVTARADEALPLVDAVLARRPDHVATRRFRGTVLANCSRHAEALEEYAALVRDYPDEIGFWISYGDTLRTLGRRAESDAAYRSGLALDRSFGRSWWGIANLGAVPLTDAEMAEIEAAIAATRADPDNLYYLHLALGTAYAKRGTHEAAFRHIDTGNRLRDAMAPFDDSVVAQEVQRTQRIMTPAFFAARAGVGDPDPAPIFVIGMPRSGSTLVEQILASHPLIEGTAELPIVPILVQTMAADHGLTLGDSYRELLPRVAPETFAALGREYLRRAQQHRRTDRPFFVDKLPHNWSDTGFIHLILPNAKIIDVRRSPLDCCWSNFQLLFARGHPSANSLRGMAAYYRHYVAMMRHFDEALPGRVHRVIYERLVDDLESETRRLLAHAGVEFDPACLAFHQTERSVATASSEQVRRPLNRQGIGAWRAYEPWLGELVEALGDLPETYAD
jgi:tetratricopeptide (TPR) repeat protein